MNPFQRSACLMLLSAAALPALADSSASSAVSDSVSTSVGSISGSVRKSSDSSSKGKDVAEGEYKVIEVASAEQSPGTARVRLQLLTDAGPAGELTLLLPEEAAARGHLAAGTVVSARHRPYGLEFAAGEQRAAFFLVLHDEWYRELNSKPVVL